MKNEFIILPLVILLIFGGFSSVSAADTGTYVGLGLNNLDIDGESSVNVSVVTGYNFHQVSFESISIQALILGVEAQYSESPSSADSTRNYSVFATARGYMSEQWYFKIKQGFTDFPDAKLKNSDAESSHIGLGLGVGYRLYAGSIELEYVYPNKTIHASLFEISYKYHF